MSDNKNSFDKNASEFLNTPQGKKIAAQKPALEQLASSADGKRVKELLGGANFEQAAKSGDVASIASAISNALKTEEGARFAAQLRELIK